MTMPDDYLRYPLRRYGMDQDIYAWSMLSRRPNVTWPNGARVALWVTPALEWFPLDMKGLPFKPPGALVTSYPDMRHYTLRDYGNRVGIYRIMKLLDSHGIKASVAVNASVAARYPSLVKACTDRGWEIIGHGLDMDHLHHGALPEDEERALIAKSLDVLKKVSGAQIRGWFSPAKSQSFATLKLLAESGLEYVCDFINDDMPYAMQVAGKRLHSMPHSTDTEDFTILINNRHDEDEYYEQIVDKFDALYAESKTQGGRVMSLALHPWVIGQPYRIATLEKVLNYIMRHSGVWPATGIEILDEWRTHVETTSGRVGE
jgi:allantoinase